MINIKSFLSKYCLSPFEPKGVSLKRFYILNIVLFILIKLSVILLGKGDFINTQASSDYWNAWVVIFILAIAWLGIRKDEGLWRFIILILYAQNRSMAFRIFLVLAIFPIEVFFLKMSNNYMENGFKMVSFGTKFIGYLYFYYLFLRVFYRAVILNKLKDISRS